MYAVMSLKVRFSVETLSYLSADTAFMLPAGTYLGTCLPIALERACVLFVLD